MTQLTTEVLKKAMDQVGAVIVTKEYQDAADELYSALSNYLGTRYSTGGSPPVIPVRLSDAHKRFAEASNALHNR